ncbi:hypothetical protein [Streptomyces chartreusis]|uniref:hypothetical protein n=1 Tax=Streptomyces chartreusis TaxID=1969 RepID=UPI001E5C72A0|nr:hypothetical protein [Streptomyces chartreusis]
MDYDTGEVRYCLKGMTGRLGLSRATVSRHVAYLREMGSLVWVEHGSLVNARRARGLGGYTRTATVYGAVIPAAYDRALGHSIVGCGYSARIVIDQRGTVPGPDDAVDNSPVDNQGSVGRETPSPTWVKEVGKLQVVGGKDSSTATRPASQIPSRRTKRKLTILGYKITSARIEQARRLAVSVRPQVTWVQGARHDQLSWVLLDMVAMNWSEPKIVLWLNQLGHEAGTRRWRPRFPHRLIAAALLRKDRTDKERADNEGTDHDQALRHSVPPNTAFAQAREATKRHREAVYEYPQLSDVPESADERALLREAVAADPELLALYTQLRGRDEAIRVYGLTAVDAMDAAIEAARAGFARSASCSEAVPQFGR